MTRSPRRQDCKSSKTHTHPTCCRSHGGSSLLTSLTRYLLGVAINRFMWFIIGDCSAQTLRMTNWLAIIFLPFVALQCRRLIEARRAERDRHGQQQLRPPIAVSIYAVHTGVNVALFPLLFFFSGVYYTDVFSTLVVLVAHWNHLERVSMRANSWKSDTLVVILGVSSLVMRQTNVFWVVVFMGGLEAVHAVKSIRPPPTSPGQFDRETMVKFYLWRYSQGEVHDPPLNKAGFEGKSIVVNNLTRNIVILICRMQMSSFVPSASPLQSFAIYHEFSSKSGLTLWSWVCSPGLSCGMAVLYSVCPRAAPHILCPAP